MGHVDLGIFGPSMPSFLIAAPIGVRACRWLRGASLR